MQWDREKKGKADKLKQLDVAELQNVWLTFDADRSLTGLFFPSFFLSFARQPASQQSKGARKVNECMSKRTNEQMVDGHYVIENASILGTFLEKH